MKWGEFKAIHNNLQDDEEIAGTVWSKQDIIAEFETMDYDFDLDDKAIDDILRGIHENQDCEYGINWNLIRCNIADYVRDRINH